MGWTSVPAGGEKFRHSFATETSCTTASRPALGPTHPIQWAPGALSPGLKRLGCGAIPPIPQYASTALCSVKRSTGTILLFTLTS